MAALTSLTQHGAQRSSQCNKAGKHNKRHVDQEEGTNFPSFRNYPWRNVKEATKPLELIKPIDQWLWAHKLNPLYSHRLAMNKQALKVNIRTHFKENKAV